MQEKIKAHLQTTKNRGWVGTFAFSSQVSKCAGSAYRMSLALRRLSSVWATQPTDPKPTDPPAEFDLAESDDGDVAGGISPSRAASGV